MPFGLKSINSYVINPTTNLEIFSITTNEKNLWDKEEGIYYLKEPRKIHPENWIEGYLSVTNSEIKQEKINIKLHGGNTKNYPQKSLRICFKDNKYTFFKNIEAQCFALRNGGNDWKETLIKDVVMQESLPTSLDRQYGKPVVVYLNGRYFGIHNLRNLYNQDYFNQPVNIAEFYYNKELEISTLKINEGNPSFKRHLEQIFKEKENLVEHFDINNLITYMSSQIIYVNKDWPFNNLKMYQLQGQDKIKLLIYDLDFGLGYKNNDSFEYEMFKHIQEDKNSYGEIFKQVLNREDTKHKLIAQILIQLNSDFARINKVIEKYEKEINNEMREHINKWGTRYFQKSIISFDKWKADINIMKTFEPKRTPALIEEISEYFYLQPITLKFEFTEFNHLGNNVKLENTQFKWFKEVPLEIESTNPDFSYFLINDNLKCETKKCVINFKGNAVIKEITK
jgi:hypothetical protein